MTGLRYILITVTLIYLSLSFNVSAQDTRSTLPVGTVNDTQVYLDELSNEFAKSGHKSPELQELKSFLPLFLNYKAKIALGRDSGLYEDPSILQEYDQYVTEAAYSFLQERVVKPKLFDEFSERSDWELKVFHVLITPNDSTEFSTIDIRLNKAREDIQKGISLDEVNKRYSSVMRGRKTGGTLPWITAGTTVKAFEDVVFDLRVGEVSEIFRTQFGFHIAVVLEKRDKNPARLVNHVYTQRKPDSSFVEKINKAYRALADSGRSWDEVVLNYSEDPASVSREGNIGWIDYTINLPEEFLNKVMTLPAPTPYTEPIETQFGYHIFKIDSIRKFDHLDDRNEFLRSRFENINYDFEDKNFILEQANKRYPDQTFTEHNVAEVTISLFPEFKEIARSYLNGLVIFKINEDHIWSANKEDSLAVQDIYQTNKDLYRIEERPFYYQFLANDTSLIEQVITYVQSGNPPSSVKSEFQGVEVSMDSSTVYENIPEFDLKSQKPETFSEITPLNDRFTTVWLDKHLESRHMTYNEAFGQIFNSYLPQKEQRFINDLRDRYNVAENYPNLEQAYKSYTFSHEN